MKPQKIVVAKFGTDVLANGLGVKQDHIDAYARGLVEKHDERGLIIVTSGAVRAGEARLLGSGLDIRRYDLRTKSQLGSASMVSAWQSAFEHMGRMSGGLLVTHNEIDDRQEGSQFSLTLNMASEKSIVSIINENDALSDEELMKLRCGGDNDGLASHVAMHIQAARLELYTKSGGIVDESGELIDEVNVMNYEWVHAMLVERELEKKRQSKDEGGGRGGMVSKLEAAWQAARRGITVIITSPTNKNGNIDMSGTNTTKVVVG